MTERESSRRATAEPPPELVKTQRSHILFVLSNPRPVYEKRFLPWYQGLYRETICNISGILTVEHYERHKVDIDGQHPPLPFQYLGLYEISVDGAQGAEAIIERVTALHAEADVAQAPGTWLYYPASEKVGRAPAHLPSMLTLAFANPIPGMEAEFREWYVTRHIRHALNIPALVSGQCLQRTLFQKPGALEARFDTIAMYEQEGTPESIIQSFKSLPERTFHFPMLDLAESRFVEWVYQPVADIDSKR